MAILADAITPLTHFFHRETLIPNLVLFTVIILTEAYLLKRIIKPIPLTKHLLFSFIINLGSSIAGSLVLLTKDSFAPLSYMSCGALVFLFALTLIVEYPIIAYLYKNKLPQRRFITVDFKINIVSYALSFVVGLVIIFGTISHLSRLDKKIMREWTHSEIIRQESGTIFTVRRNENKKGYCLQSYELQTQTWVKTPVNIPDRSKWDISIDGNLIAFSDAGAVIQRLSEPSPVSKIPGDFTRLKIAPSNKLLALLEDKGIVVGKRSSKSYYRFGRKCKLHVYSIDDNKQVFEYDEPILSDGLCWSPDSKKILFVSFRDKDLFILEERQVDGTDEYGEPRYDVSYGRPDFHPKYVYMYDTENHTATELCEGIEPQWSHDGKKILFISKGNVFIYNCDTGQEELLCKTDRIREPKWSPSDNCIIGLFPRKVPFSSFYASLLTIIDAKNPHLRLIIDVDGNDDSFVWTK